MNNIEANIPDPILRKLNELRPQLEQQGIVQPHDTAFRIRFRAECEYGYIVHRSIGLGSDPAIADAVRQLLTVWREEHAVKVAERAETAAAGEREIQERRNQQRLLIALDSGGKRRRQQLQRFFSQIETEPNKALKFAMTGELPARPKLGRPRKGIWGASGHALDITGSTFPRMMFQDGNLRVAEKPGSREPGER